MDLQEKILAAIASANGELAYPNFEPLLTPRERTTLYRTLQDMKRQGKIVMEVRKDVNGVQTTYIKRGAN